MAIYHCSVQVIGRNAGRSSVAAAAYRAGEDLVNEYDGIEHDFTKKNWVEYTEIILPDNAPKEYADRSTLWNAVEMIEKTSDAQLAREFELALPSEMTREQQLEVVHQFVQDKLTSQGMVADIAIHNPPVTNDRHQPIDVNRNVTRDIEQMQFINPHAHVMVTVRPMTHDGKWENKSETEYLCKRGDEERGFTAKEFKEAKEEGWEKQYRFYEGKKKVYYSASEGKEKELERVNRSPKTTPYGRKNKTVEYWNDKDRIFEWRQYWEKVVNDKFKEIQSDVRIDCRSFKDQGRVDEQPTLHMGTAATNMEKRAVREIHEGKSEAQVIRSDIGNINRQIKEHNKFVRELKAKLDAMVEKAKDYIEEIVRKLEGIRGKIIGNAYEENVLTHKYRFLTSKLIPTGEKLTKYKTEIENATKANDSSAKKIRRFQKELKECLPHQFLKKSNIQSQIKEEQEAIESRTEYISNIGKMCGFQNLEEYEVARKEYFEKNKEYKKLEETISGIQDDTKKLVEEYVDGAAQISSEQIQEAEERRLPFRQEIETVTKDGLTQEYGYGFDVGIYAEARKDADKLLGITDYAKQKNIHRELKNNQSLIKENVVSDTKKKSRTHHR